MTDFALVSPTDIETEVVNEIFFKGIRQGQHFFFASDESEEVFTKQEGLFYTNDQGKRFSASAMTKCILL